MNPPSVLRLFAALLALGVLAAACSDADADGTRAEDIEAFPDDLLPPTVLDLAVEPEDITPTLAGVEDSYLKRVSLYSFRRDDLLQATLEVAELIEAADIEKPEFRRNLADQVGNALPRELQMGNQTVFVTAGSGQGISVWFLDDYMFVLATRADYEQPRALMRELLDVRPSD